MDDLRVGIIPYSPGFNPYQKLFAESMESAGIQVTRIAGRKFFPISHALSYQIDLLHMNWPHSFYTGRSPFLTKVKRAMYWYDLRKLRKHPFVYTAENLYSHDAKDPADDIRMVQKLLDCCDGIVTMTRAAEELLRSTYAIGPETRIAIIPHGNYIGVYPNDISRTEARRKLELPDEARVVLAFGRVKRYKGLDTLIETFAESARRGDVLAVAGAPQDEDFCLELQSLADSVCRQGPQVRLFFREVPADELQVFFNACDVVALPYQDAPMNPGGLVLAMSFGRCVVAPGVGSIPETACPEAYFGYDREDAGGLTAALLRALDQPDLLERGAASRQFAREHYDWSDIGCKLRAMYEEILGRS